MNQCQIDEKFKNGHALFMQDLYKLYGDKVVLDNVDLAVSPGELCTVVGPSGCGKSTLLRLIVGQEQPTKGIVCIDGVDADFPDSLRGIVYQKYSLFPNLRVIDNVMLGRKLKSSLYDRFFNNKELSEEAEALLVKVRLGEHLHKFPHELSGGQQQRVAIAQSLITQPKILLMDEPFGALDPGTREHMQVLLLDLWEQYKMTVFFVTHDLEEAVFVGTRIIVLSQYYEDSRGEKCANRGARIVADYPLDKKTVASTDVKKTAEFGALIQDIRQDCFDPNHLQRIEKFNLKHPDSFMTEAEGV
jgi:NitT/TauT family transport system ATP-binding protein